jgi:hypothetical protein
MKRVSIMIRATAGALLATLLLSGCGAGGGTAVTDTPNKSVSEAQRTLSIVKMPADQRRAALRRALPSGTKVYAVETETFSVPDGILLIPKSSEVSYSGTTLVWRLADGTTKTAQNAKLVAQDRSGEQYVMPGKPIPASLQGQTPEVVIP